MEQKTITISLDGLVNMEQELKKNTDLASEYESKADQEFKKNTKLASDCQIKAEELEEKIENAVTKVFGLLDFSSFCGHICV